MTTSAVAQWVSQLFEQHQKSVDDTTQSCFRGDRYKPLARIGFGAYGSVCAAVDTMSENRKKVALKRITNALAVPMGAQRVLREVCILRQLGSHPNILKLFDVLRPHSYSCQRLQLYLKKKLQNFGQKEANAANSLTAIGNISQSNTKTFDIEDEELEENPIMCCIWKDLILVTELLQTDLQKVIVSRQPLSVDHIA